MSEHAHATDLRAVPDDEYREPPHDITAEQCTLGGMLLARDVVDDVARIVGPESFYRPAHGVIFQAITRIHGQGEPADAVTVVDDLVRTGDLPRVGGAPYIHDLIARVPTAANATHYAEIVRDRRKLRRLIEAGTRLVQRGYGTDPADVDSAVSQARTDLEAEDTGPVDLQGNLESIDDTFDWLGTDPADDPSLIPTPYTDLAHYLNGLEPGQMITVGARPGTGKSVVALDIARYAAYRAGVPVFLASLEMSKREVNRRLIAAEARIPLNLLKERRLTEDHWQKAVKVRERIAQAPNLIVDDTRHVTLSSLRSALRRMARRPDTGAPSLVVVDYLQLMSSTSRAENRQVEVSELSRGLKILAGEFDVPVVVLSQLNRASEARSDKRPNVADLRESGAVEQDSDVVMLLHRDDMYEPESPKAGEMDLIIGKNRNGPTGTVTVAFQGHYSRAADMAKDHQGDR